MLSGNPVIMPDQGMKERSLTTSGSHVGIHDFVPGKSALQYQCVHAVIGYVALS